MICICYCNPWHAIAVCLFRDRLLKILECNRFNYEQFNATLCWNLYLFNYSVCTMGFSLECLYAIEWSYQGRSANKLNCRNKFNFRPILNHRGDFCLGRCNKMIDHIRLLYLLLTCKLRSFVIPIDHIERRDGGH